MTNDTTARAHVVAAEEGEALWFGPNRMTMKAKAADTGGAYGLLHSHVPAGSSPPLHVHHAEDEAFYVIAGELRIRCGDEEFRAGAGAFAFLPRDVPHTFVAESDVEMLTLLSPGGGERFFADGGRPAEGLGLPPVAPPDVPALARAAGQYDMEILGPPMTAG